MLDVIVSVEHTSVITEVVTDINVIPENKCQGHRSISTKGQRGNALYVKYLGMDMK